MKNAIENGNIVDFTSAIKGNQNYTCAGCGKRVFFKPCENGNMQAHFAHYNKEECEYAENLMSAWHKEWQSHFPEQNREVPVQNDGKLHIADVLIDNKVIEFQHSPISKENFEGRNNFYTNLKYKMYWVFDMTGKARVDEEKGLIYTDKWLDCFKDENIKYNKINLFFEIENKLFFVYEKEKNNDKEYVFKFINFHSCYKEYTEYISKSTFLADFIPNENEIAFSLFFDNFIKKIKEEVKKIEEKNKQLQTQQKIRSIQPQAMSPIFSHTKIDRLENSPYYQRSVYKPNSHRTNNFKKHKR